MGKSVVGFALLVAIAVGGFLVLSGRAQEKRIQLEKVSFMAGCIDGALFAVVGIYEPDRKFTNEQLQDLVFKINRACLEIFKYKDDVGQQLEKKHPNAVDFGGKNEV